MIMSQEINKKIIFFDIDLLTAPAKEQKTDNSDSIQETFKKHCIHTNTPDDLHSLNDDEILLLDQWNSDLADKLPDIAGYNEKCDFILISDKITQEKLRLICDFKGLSFKELICCPDKQHIVNAISSYISSDEETENYAIISRFKLEQDFRGHTIFIESNTDYKELKAKVYYIFHFNMRNDYLWYSDDRDSREKSSTPFTKVIFLDIDGVLNDDGYNRSKGIYVDPEMVKNLAYIIRNTGADVILSSSWRLGYKKFIENNYQSDEKEYLQLYELLTAEGITVKGCTPLSDKSGSAARPYEIREWLNRFPSIFSYVILDDDTFWDWGFLQRNVVTTKIKMTSYHSYSEYTRGLTMSQAKKAVEILNDRGAKEYGF